MPRNQFQRMVFALLTVVVTVHAYVFYSLYVINGGALMEVTGQPGVLAAIRAQGGVLLCGKMAPIWAVVLVAYLLLGIFSGAWWQGLFLLFLIPVYYIVGAAIVSRRVAPMLCGLYPVGATAWFFWMAFVVGQWHPAWVIFLTIPLAEMIIVKTSERWHRRHDTIEVTVE